MDPALKLNCFFAHFPYGGNGGVSSEIPQIRRWEVETFMKMSRDKRIGWFESHDFSDTPITMTRNRAIRAAKERGAHLLLMIDSDNDPLKHVGEPWFKPFWDEAFTFIYDNYQAGPRLVCAPYCGPPNGVENVYVFRAESYGNKSQETGWKLSPYTRGEAAEMTGIQEIGAGPTGLILIDLRLLELIEPVNMTKEQVLNAFEAGLMTKEQALYAMRDGYCYYEWENQNCDQKASTEDVTLIRDICLAGLARWGYNPCFCAWDSWIGHHKPWNVGKPERYTMEHVNASYRKAVLDGVSANERIVDMGNLNQGNDPLSRHLRSLAAAAESAFNDDHKSNGHKSNDPLADYKSVPWHEHGKMPEHHVKALVAEVKTMLPPLGRLRVLEVGTWMGGTAIAMADAGNVNVHCIDTWEGSPSDETSLCVQDAGGPDAAYAEFEKRVGSRLNETIFPWQDNSQHAAAMHWDKFDLIFIDAEHTYEAVKADILAWWRHLKDDGVMMGHDYKVNAFPGVKKAVQELFGDKVREVGMCNFGCIWKVQKSDFPNGLVGDEVALHANS